MHTGDCDAVVPAIEMKLPARRDHGNHGALA